jgi:hypothetical protein
MTDKSFIKEIAQLEEQLKELQYDVAQDKLAIAQRDIANLVEAGNKLVKALEPANRTSHFDQGVAIQTWIEITRQFNRTK